MDSSLIVLAAAVILGILGVRVVGEEERLAIMRLGRFIGVRGPGIAWVVPVLDKTTRVSLEREIPQWRSLSTEQLTNEIERRLTTSGLGSGRASGGG
jgi:regulator of protease activity HflC (stomatin/prohibitin superfamily)